MVKVLEVDVKNNTEKYVDKDIVLSPFIPLPIQKTDKEILLELLNDSDVKIAVKNAVK